MPKTDVTYPTEGERSARTRSNDNGSNEMIPSHQLQPTFASSPKVPSPTEPDHLYPDCEKVDCNRPREVDIEAGADETAQPEAYTTFTLSQKRFIVAMVAVAAMISPLASSSYFPALPLLAEENHVSIGKINLTVTTYMIFQGIAPTIFGDLADMAGRRPAYLLAFIVFLCANIGLALQSSFAALLVLRCLQSSGSSGTIALAGGVVGDIASPSERGTYMGLALSGPQVGPALGPVIGGILAKTLGWRAIFWFLVIFAGVGFAIFAVTFPETGRNVVGNGSIPPQTWNVSALTYLHTQRHAGADEKIKGKETMKTKRRLRIPNPAKVLLIIIEKDVALVLFYTAIVYTAFIYGFNELQVGLCYIPNGVGCALASVLNGKLLDWNFRRVGRQAGLADIDPKDRHSIDGFPIEKARIQSLFPIVYLGTASVVCYGWALFMNAPLAAPLVLQFLIGLTLTSAINCTLTLLVDLYPLSPSTATAASNLTRCLFGAVGTALIQQMLDAMGRGWCFTFLGLLCLVFSPMLTVLIKWGPKWRRERKERIDRKALSA